MEKINKIFYGGKFVVSLFFISLLLSFQLVSDSIAGGTETLMQMSNLEPAAAKVCKEANWAFYAGAHLRTSFNVLGNNVYLGRHGKTNSNYYLGYVYDFTLDLRHIWGPEAYIFIERRGRADYDCPLWGRRQIDTIFGTYHWYHRSAMTPRVREFWFATPLTPTQEINCKFGLYPYGREVGHRIALGGKYENYGVTLSGENEAFNWNFHWEKEDINQRIHLGKVIDFDKVNRYNDTSAGFFAADADFKLGNHKLQVYLGWLRDTTSQGARNSKFNAVVKKENLFTPGAYLSLNYGKLNLGFEAARNFGKAKSVDNSRYPDINHKGYLLIADAIYNMGSFKPKTKVFVASGNKFNENDFRNPTIMGGDNHAFSVFSPLNTNLTDSHYQKQFGPYVAMAGGYAVNFGIPRPGTFGDPFIFENLIAYTLGFDYTPLDKWYVGMDYWYLRSKEHGWGLDGVGAVKEFPTDLGNEVDIFVSYQLTKNTKLSLLGGIFFPGKYYKQTRSDNSATNVFSPTPRRDGKVKNAYQIELGVDINF